MDIAGESVEEFRQYFRNKKIYFPKHIADSIEELISESRRVYRHFRILRVHDEQNARTDDAINRWMDAWEKLTEEEIPALREELEDHFRALIGVETGRPAWDRQHALGSETEADVSETDTDDPDGQLDVERN